MYKDVFRSALNDVVNDAIDLITESVEVDGTPLEDYFPYAQTKTIEIDGRRYRMMVEIKLR